MPSKRKRISARAFSNRFIKIVSRHLSALRPEEQDKQIRDAERTALGASHAERPTAHRVGETRTIPLLSLVANNRKEDSLVTGRISEQVRHFLYHALTG